MDFTSPFLYSHASCLIIPVHVDDGLAITNSRPLYQWFVEELSHDLEVVDLGAASLYLGMHITRDRPHRKLWILQKPAIVDLLETWNLLDCTPQKVPLPHRLDSLKPCQPNSCADIADHEIEISYQRIVGSLTYLSICTRPDISYATLALSQYNANPSRTQLLAAKGVLRYLAGTQDYGLEYSISPSALPTTVIPHMSACALSDADWASDTSDRKSVSGYAFFCFGSLVSWSSSRQKVVAASSTDSEYYAMSNAVREALWIRLFLTINHFPVPKPFPLFSDNQSAITIANKPNHVNSSRSKHIDVRYHFIRERIDDGTFETIWLPTADMTADIFTKPLPVPSFEKHRAALGIVPVL